MLECGVIELRDLVDVLESLLGLIGNLLFGELLVVKLDDFLDGAGTLAEIVADGDELLDDDGRTGDGLHHHQLAALDALGDGHFALAGKQGHGAHFAEVHANRIVGLFERTRGQIEVAALFGMSVVFESGFTIVLDRQFYGQRRFGCRLVFVNLDTVALKSGQKVIDLFRRVHLGRKRIVHFVVKQVAALFADGNEGFYRFVFFFKNLRHKSSTQSPAFRGPQNGPQPSISPAAGTRNPVITHDGPDARTHVFGLSPSSQMFLL